MKNRKSILGFTLIELLIVVTIIGILAVVFLPTILGAPEKARDATRKADLANTVQAIEAGRLEGEDVSTLTTVCLSAINVKWKPFFGGGIIPADPLDTNDAIVTGCGVAGQYLLKAPGATDKFKYQLYARMELADNQKTACPGDAGGKTECYMVETSQ